MSRRGKRHPARGLPFWLVALALLLAFAVSGLAAAPVNAQAATTAPTTGAAAGTPAPTSGTPGTPTPTRTPAPTATPTATLTELQARLALAKAYLDGKDYDSAATLYAQIVEDTRGNTEALAGLQSALAGKAAIQATQMAPLPTEAPTPIPVQEDKTLAGETRSKVIDGLAVVLAGVLLIVLLYLLAALLRWLLSALRELWYTRILPLLGRPAVAPGFLLGEFTAPVGTDTEAAARFVPVAITEKLAVWNQLVQDKQAPVELAPALDLGPMAWLKVLWSWILPRPRGYRVSGTLFDGPGGQHQLAIQRTDLGRNSVDRSHIFESRDGSAAQAYRDLAGEAAKWLIMPGDMEAGTAASTLFDRVLDTLLPVRRQVNQGQVDFPTARQQLSAAEALTAQLPANSALRAELSRVIADLRKSVPGG